MLSRISDPRLVDPDPSLALIVDLLKACVTLQDLDFMFDELSAASGTTWRIQVDASRALLFEWVEQFGAISVRLE